MFVECVLSNVESDVRCAVCGQGFLLFADRLLHRHRERFRLLVQGALRLHHTAGEHPAHRFAIPLSEDLLQALQFPLSV